MKKFAAVAAAVAAGFLVGVVGLSVSAFVVMIFVGMWHGHNDAVPALGFVDCLYGVGLVGLLAAVAAPVTRD